ncbi:hypothetical protein [Carnobacterium maltaromaticum]|uniref:hypothetical protein n=1 Tax=Carnobacterium maltaromaticum TaxID=2751 RepID=UPI00191BC43C|nr:hypothetical protein [Carnobacterium maltaromaticum]CAD5898171.1 conserved hypothetical protein [Carnobacterium maltaromaticum]
MKDEKLFKEKIIKDSSVPFVAAEDGTWINADGDKLAIRNMPTDYLEHCLKTLNNADSWGEIGSLKNYMNGKINDDNSDMFNDYLVDLIENKIKQVKDELKRR